MRSNSFETYLYYMQFDEIINARVTDETDRPHMKKEFVPVSEGLHVVIGRVGLGITARFDINLVCRDNDPGDFRIVEMSCGEYD